MRDKNFVCGIYARLSVKDERAIEYQVTLLKEFAKEKGRKVYRIYKDIGYSGDSLVFRPELKRMMNDAQEKKLDVILAMSPDRITQDDNEWSYIKRLLGSLEVDIVYYD